MLFTTSGIRTSFTKAVPAIASAAKFVPADTKRLPAFFGHWAHASTDVDLNGNGLQVGGIYARSVPTQVVNRQAVSNSPVVQFIGNTVRVKAFPLPGGGPSDWVMEGAVAIKQFAANPYPAIYSRPFFNFCPEGFGKASALVNSAWHSYVYTPPIATFLGVK